MPAFVPAAARTMSIFETFAQHRRELSNAEIAKLLGVAESSSSDLLHTLYEIGYLMRTARSRRFYPTARLQSLATSIATNNPLVLAGQEAIELLSDRTGETAICGVLGDHHVEVAGIREGKYELRYILEVGGRIGLHVSALGKALLALSDPKDAHARMTARPLKKVTPHSVIDLATLEKQFRDIRKRGYASVENEGTEGVSAMAIAGRVGGELMAVSIAGPSERLKRNAKAYREALLEVKNIVFPAEVATATTRPLADDPV
jgi:DNA-binding IclR family transcriptional regulator